MDSILEYKNGSLEISDFIFFKDNQLDTTE